MYRVLVPVDGNEERAAGQIEAIERLQDEMAELHADILYVYEEIDAPADEAGPGTIDAINENLEDLQGLPDTIGTVVDALEAKGAMTEVHDSRGDPGVTILNMADAYDVDAIVVGARRRTPIGKVLFGSVTQSVILESDRPVLVASA